MVFWMLEHLSKLRVAGKFDIEERHWLDVVLITSSNSDRILFFRREKLNVKLQGETELSGQLVAVLEINTFNKV